MIKTWRSLIESLLVHGLLWSVVVLATDQANQLTGPALVKLDLALLSTTAVSPSVPSAAAAMAPVAPPKPQQVVARPAPAPVKKSIPKSAPAPRPEPVPEAEPVVAEALPPPQTVEDPVSASDPVVSSSPAAPSEPKGTDATSAVISENTAIAGTSSRKESAALAAGYRSTNFSAIRHTILGRLCYPLLARRQGWTGRVEIAFRVATDGNLLDARIATSSGYPLLDEQALNAVRKAAPYPPPPVVVQLLMPVLFELN